MKSGPLKSARASAVHDRLAMLHALAVGDVISQRRAALRVWGSSARLLASLDAERHARAFQTARRWSGWSEIFLVRGAIDPGLAAAVQHATAERTHADQRGDHDG